MACVSKCVRAVCTWKLLDSLLKGCCGTVEASLGTFVVCVAGVCVAFVVAFLQATEPQEPPEPQEPSEPEEPQEPTPKKPARRAAPANLLAGIRAQARARPR